MKLSFLCFCLQRTHQLSSFSGRVLNNFQVTPTKKERKWIQPILNTFLLPIVITLARTHVPILPRMFLTLPIAWHPEYFNLCANMYTNNGTKMFDKVCSYYLGQGTINLMKLLKLVEFQNGLVEVSHSVSHS